MAGKVQMIHPDPPCGIRERRNNDNENDSRNFFENGVFRPTEPVSLPDQCEVRLELRVTNGLPDSGGAADPAAGEQRKPSIEDKLATLAARVPQSEWDRLPKGLSDNF